MKPQDMKDLRELIEFLKQYQVAEFDLDRGDIKIRLKFAQAAPTTGIADLARLTVGPAAAAPATHFRWQISPVELLRPPILTLVYTSSNRQ